jgi:uncharacterized protein with PQ loop repeat
MADPSWKSSVDMDPFDLYMVAIAIFGKTFLLLQIVKVISGESSKNVSATSYLVYFIVSVSWLVFSMQKRETVVFISSVMGIILSLIALCVIGVYRVEGQSIW